MPVIRRLTVAATAATAAAAVALTGVAVPTAPASAATQCTAWGAMPKRVALHSARTDVALVLRGTAGCHDQRTDNGATADLVDPSGSSESMRFRHFGSTQSVALYVNIARSGSYVLRNGDVQVYNHSYRRVAWSWHRTVMVVKRAAHLVRPHAANGVVTARAIRYSKYGWAGYRGTRVSVQRRPVGTHAWHSLGSVRAARKGYVRFATPTSSRYQYRLHFTKTPSIWGATAIVRG